MSAESPGQATDQLVKLSDEFKRLGLDQQTDKFVRELRKAVRLGTVDATYLGERIEMPKVFRFKSTTPLENRKRKHLVDERASGYRKQTSEMMILSDDRYEAWFSSVRERLHTIELNAMRLLNERMDTAEKIMSDPTLNTFYRNVENTRARIARQQEHGQTLATERGFNQPNRKSKKGRKKDARATEDTKDTKTQGKKSRKQASTQGARV